MKENEFLYAIYFVISNFFSIFAAEKEQTKKNSNK